MIILKILHTSDWHLGRILYGGSLIKDQKHFIENVFLPICVEEKPDAVLISGDIYDRQIASVEAIRLFDETLLKLSELDIAVCVISGNHDGADRIAIMKAVLKKSGVNIATSVSDSLIPVELEKDDTKVQIFMLPYMENSQVREFFSEPELKGENACMHRVIKELKLSFKPGYKKILMAHCFVAGSQKSDSESTIFVGGSGEVSTSAFEDFDYVALGHLHGPQRAGENGRYSGSPLKYSVDEEKHKKTVVMLDISDDIKHRLIEIKPLRDVRRIKGAFEELMEKDAEDINEDYVEIELTDKKPVLFAPEKLREYYPNVLAVRNNWMSEGIGGSRRELKKESEKVIFGAFMQDICGIEPDEETSQMFMEILREAKGGKET